MKVHPTMLNIYVQCSVSVLDLGDITAKSVTEIGVTITDIEDFWVQKPKIHLGCNACTESNLAHAMFRLCRLRKAVS